MKYDRRHFPASTDSRPMSHSFAHSATSKPVDQLREATPFANIAAVNPLDVLQDHDVEALTRRPSL